MKKFTKIPIGLGINHYEQEQAIAHHWNQCVDEGVDPSELIEVPEVRKHNFKFCNYETGLSLINTGHVEEVDGKWRLTQKTIDKCKKFLSEI